MLRLAVLGAGFMGGTHARALARMPHVEVVAIAGRRPERAQALAREVGARVVSLEEVLRDPSIDAVDVSLPTFMHREFVVGALEAGKHCIVEKPMASSLEDADAMIAAAHRSGKTLMVAQVLRFWPEYVRLHELAAGGALGTVRVVAAGRYSFFPNWAEWIQHPELTGGPVVDLMVHDFDQVNWLLGTPRAVFARGVRGRSGAHDHVIATVSYEGAEAVVEGSEMMPDTWPFTSTIRAIGDAATAEYIFRAGGPSVEMGQTQSGLSLYPTRGEAQVIAVPQADPYYAELEYFVECVRTGEQPTRVTLESARLALQLCLAARRSLEEGRRVEVT